MYNLDNEHADLVLEHTDGSKEYLTVTELACVVHHTPSGILIYEEEEAITTVTNDYPKESGWSIPFFSERWADMVKAYNTPRSDTPQNLEGKNELGFTGAFLRRFWSAATFEKFSEFMVGQTISLVDSEVTYHFIDVQNFCSMHDEKYPTSALSNKER